MPQPASSSNVGVEQFATQELMQIVADLAVAGHAGGVAEQDLAHVDRKIAVLVDEVRELRNPGAKRALIVGPAAVTVKLDVREMGASAFKSLHGRQRRAPVAGKAQIVAMDVNRVRQTQIHDRLRQLTDDPSRRDVEAGKAAVKGAGEPSPVRGRSVRTIRPLTGLGSPAPLFPRLDAAGIDELDSVGLRPVHDPADEGSQPGRIIAGNLLQGVVIVAQENVKALVDDRRVLQFFVGLASAERSDGGVESGRVAEPRVEMPGGDGRRHAGLAVSRILRPQSAGGIHLGPCDVCVHVDAAGHDDPAGRIDDLFWTKAGIIWRCDDLAVLDPEVHDDAVDSMNGIVHRPAGDLE